jgi:hypothetical protein
VVAAGRDSYDRIGLIFHFPHKNFAQSSRHSFCNGKFSFAIGIRGIRKQRIYNFNATDGSGTRRFF